MNDTCHDIPQKNAIEEGNSSVQQIIPNLIRFDDRHVDEVWPQGTGSQRVDSVTDDTDNTTCRKWFIPVKEAKNFLMERLFI